MSSLRPLAAVMAALSLVACSSSSDSPTASNNTTVTYEGVFATGTQTGTVSLVAGSPATGSLKISGASTVSLSGSYNSATSTFALTGGGYALAATVDANKNVSGTLTGSSAATTGVVAALAVAAGEPKTTWCGTFNGTNSGKLNLIIKGNTASALAVETTGEGTNLTGTVNGAGVTLGWKPMISPGVYGTGTATGTISGATITGIWSNTLGEHGNWTASQTC